MGIQGKEREKMKRAVFYLVIAGLLAGMITGGCARKQSPAPAPEPAAAPKPAQSNKEDVLIVQSGDGRASLEIPKSALPAGVDPNDISVSRLAEYNLPVIGADDSQNITYRLEPDGLEFNEPVIFKTSFDNPGHGVPLVFLVTGDNQVEVLENTEIAIDPETDIATVMAPVSHFSQLTINVALTFFSYKVEAADIFVGHNTEAKAIISKSNIFDITVAGVGNEDDNALFKAIPGTAQITANLRPAFFLTPTHTFYREPPLTAFGDTFTIPNNKYVCTDKTRTSVYWDVTFVVKMEKFVYDVNEDPRESEMVDTITVKKTNKLFLSASFECKVDPATEDEGPGVSVADPDPDGISCPDAKLLSKDAEGAPLKVNKLKDGKCYPAMQFLTPSGKDACEEVHYHVRLTSLGGTIRNDSQPCGAAVESDIIQKAEIWVEPKQFKEVTGF